MLTGETKSPPAGDNKSIKNKGKTSGTKDLFQLTWIKRKERKEKSKPEANPFHLFIGLLLLIIVTGIYVYLFFGISREPEEVPSYLVHFSPSPEISPSPSPSPKPKKQILPPGMPPGMPPPGMPPGMPPPGMPPGMPPPGQPMPPGQPPPGQPMPPGQLPSGPPGMPVDPGKPVEEPLDPWDLPENPAQKVELYIYSNIPASVYIDDSRGKRLYGKTVKSKMNSRLYSMKLELKWGTYNVELQRSGYGTLRKKAKFTKTLWEKKLFFNLEKSYQPDFSK